MSILIRSNVHLPRSCRKCPFNGGDWCIASEKVRIGKHGNVNEHRHPDCPLVEIPTQHGRLIDAGALANKYERFHRILKGSNLMADKVRRDEIDMFLSELKCNAPTIIEAEASE